MQSSEVTIDGNRAVGDSQPSGAYSPGVIAGGRADTVTGRPAGEMILRPSPMALPAAELGESACWDPETGSFYWIDSPAGLVYRLDGSGEHASWKVGPSVGVVRPRAAGGLAVGAGDGFLILDPATGTVTKLAATEPDKPENRMNDGACDRAGRFYAGTMAADESPGQGALYRLDPDHRVTRLCTGVGISNGIGWSPDERLMYYVDSLAYRCDVFDYDAATGAISGRRPFASLGEGDVVPDGLAVDVEGGVWVAVWGGGLIQRYSADGRTAGVVELPAARVTSLAFGGPDLDQLYITTANGPGSFAGALFTCPSPVAGLATHPYRG
jgi:sugar lactone lactonase YvrE